MNLPVKIMNDDIVNNSVTMVKPNPLIEIKDRYMLTQVDHKVLNLLIKNSWEEISEDKIHCIKKAELKGLHKTNRCLEDTMDRLHKSYVVINCIYEGEPSIMRINLIDFTVENERKDGSLYYSFNNKMRQLIKEAKYFTRLEHTVLRAINSKYGLILYEMIAKREKMRLKYYKFPLNELRELLGVEPDKHLRFNHFKVKVLDKAIDEVNAKSPFHVKYSTVKTGRSVSHIMLSWSTQRERKQIEKEEDYGEFGVPKRIVDLRNSRLQDKMFIVPQQTINKLGKLGVNMDLYQLEEEFYGANQGKKIRNVSKAFQGFFDFRRQQVLF